jgi:chromosomal replication initiator protein
VGKVPGEAAARCRVAVLMGDAVGAEAVQQSGNNGSADPEAWPRILGQLRSEVGEAAFRNWFQPLNVRRVEDDHVVLAMPTKFLRDYVVTHYGDRLLSLWRGENRRVERVSIVVAAPEAPAAAAVPPPAREPAAEGAAELDLCEALSTPLEPRFTFANFIVGKPNELAHATSRHVAEACAAPDRAVPFNPLFLYGGVGLGKTHLMHGIAWHIRQTAPGRKVIYVSAEQFMYQFIRALRFKSTMDFKAQFRSVDLLMIDDVQFIANKEATQDEFFHTFNALVDQGRQIVLSADKSPSDIEGLDERVRSRLGWGVVADLHPTTYELRLGIIESKTEQMGLPLQKKVKELIAHKIVSNVRELEGALNRIAAHMKFIGREITLETAQEVLHDLLRSHEKRLTIDEIQRRVAEHFNVRLGEMTSARRARAVARPRQVAMYLAKQLTSRSLPEIGRRFGDRDHTTVMHAIKKIEQLKAIDPALAEDVDLLRRMLQG